MRDDRDVTVIETGSGLKWFVLGAALGAGLGLLFAPQSGERTRRDLAKRGRRLRTQAEDALGDVADDVQASGRRFKEKVVEFADEVLEEVNATAEEVEEEEEEEEEEAPTARQAMQRRLARARAKARAAVGAEATEEDDDEGE